MKWYNTKVISGAFDALLVSSCFHTALEYGAKKDFGFFFFAELILMGFFAYSLIKSVKAEMKGPEIVSIKEIEGGTEYTYTRPKKD